MQPCLHHVHTIPAPNFSVLAHRLLDHPHSIISLPPTILQDLVECSGWRVQVLQENQTSGGKDEFPHVEDSIRKSQIEMDLVTPEFVLKQDLVPLICFARLPKISP